LIPRVLETQKNRNSNTYFDRELNCKVTEMLDQHLIIIEPLIAAYNSLAPSDEQWSVRKQQSMIMDSLDSVLLLVQNAAFKIRNAAGEELTIVSHGVHFVDYDEGLISQEHLRAYSDNIDIATKPMFMTGGRSIKTIYFDKEEWAELPIAEDHCYYAMIRPLTRMEMEAMTDQSEQAKRMTSKKKRESRSSQDIDNQFGYPGKTRLKELIIQMRSTGTIIEESEFDFAI
jgi:hypothetical protein